MHAKSEMTGRRLSLGVTTESVSQFLGQVNGQKKEATKEKNNRKLCQRKG